jgi:hypothetical protein
MIAQSSDPDDTTLSFAQDAQVSVRALVELLRGCPAGYQISAGLFVGLLVSVECQLENVVGDLRCQLGMPPPSLVTTGQGAPH